MGMFPADPAKVKEFEDTLTPAQREIYTPLKQQQDAYDKWVKEPPGTPGNSPGRPDWEKLLGKGLDHQGGAGLKGDQIEKFRKAHGDEYSGWFEANDGSGGHGRMSPQLEKELRGRPQKTGGATPATTSSQTTATPVAGSPEIPVPPSSGPAAVKTSSTLAASSGGSGFGGLFGGGFSEFFNKIGQMITEFLAKLGIGGGSSGPSVTAKPATAGTPTQVAQATTTRSASPTPQPTPQPTAQPSVAQPPAQAAAVTPVRAPAQTDLTARKPTAEEAGQPLPAGKLSPEDAARAEATQKQVGKPNGELPTDLPIIKQSPAETSDSVKTTASVDVQQQWEALRGNFGVTDDNLAKLKTPDTTAPAANEETVTASVTRQTNSFKV